MFKKRDGSSTLPVDFCGVEDNRQFNDQHKSKRFEGNTIVHSLVSSSPSTQVAIGKVTCKALCDSGSMVSVMSKDFFYNHFRQMELKNCADLISVKAANGTPIPVFGYVFLKTWVALLNKFIDIGYLVADRSGDSFQIVLGMNVLKQANSFQNLGTKVASSNVKSRSRVAKTNNRDPILLSARSMQGVKLTMSGSSENNESGLVHVEPLNSFKSCGIMVYGGLCQANDVKLLVCNPHDYDIWIGEYTAAALVTPFDPFTDLELPEVSFDVQAQELVVGNIEATLNTDGFDINLVKPGVELSEGEQAAFHDLIREYQDVFAKNDSDIGFCDRIYHEIRVKDDIPVKVPRRRLHPADIKPVQQEIKKLLAAGVVKPSNSPYCSPIVAVKKRDETGKQVGIRLAIDYRKLNSKIVDDAQSIPSVQELLELGYNSRYFSSIDLIQGFFQLALSSKSSELTAFDSACGLGTLEFRVLPQGLKCSSAKFQHTLESIFQEELFVFLAIYIDDLLCFSKSVSDHLNHLKVILQKLRENNLKIKASKCRFFCENIDYLGHEISSSGIRTSPKKTEAISKLPEPRNFSDLHSHLGLFSYYRRFVPKFGQIASCLHKVLTHAPRKPNSKYNSKRIYPLPEVKKPFHLLWDENCRTAWQTLKDSIVNSDCLVFPNFKRNFMLEVDASLLGYGACLSQEQDDGTRRVIAFASRSLRPNEKSHVHQSSRRLELGALRWAMTEKFRPYLASSHCIVLTDHNPLRYLLNAKLSATELRWLGQLSSFSFEIKYRPGSQNTVADCLSRSPIDDRSAEPDDEYEDNCVPQTMIDIVKKTIQDASPLLDESEPSLSVVSAVVGEQIPDSFKIAASSLLCHPNKEQVAMSHELQVDVGNSLSLVTLPQISLDELKQEQSGDSALAPCFHELGKSDSSFVLSDDVLYFLGKDELGDTCKLLVVPQKYRTLIFESLHDKMGHPGRSRSESLILQRFFWPGIRKDIRDMVARCSRCKVAKTPARKVKLIPGHLTVNRSNECVALDFTVLEKAQGFDSVLVMTDHFSKFVVAIPVKDQSAKTVAKCLFQHWICSYGLMNRIHSDRGRCFESNIVKELCLLLGIKQTTTAGYSSFSNGICERWNRTFHSLLKTLENDQKQKWPSFLKEICFMYNSTPHSVTGYSPFFLMTGRKCTLGIEFLLPTSKPNREDLSTDWATLLKNRLQIASYLAAKQMTKRALERREKSISQGGNDSPLHIGSHVLMRNRIPGMAKIQDHWLSTPFVIKDRIGTRAYRVSSLNSLHNDRLVRREDLLPLDSSSQLSLSSTPLSPRSTPTPSTPIPRPRTRLYCRQHPSSDNSISSSPGL